MEGHTLQCELGSEDHSRQTEVFREAQTSFNRYQCLKEQSGLSLDCGSQTCSLPQMVPDEPLTF